MSAHNPAHCRSAALIREAREADADSIGQLWLEMAHFHQTLDAQTFQAAADGDIIYARRIRQGLCDPWTHVLVATADGLVVAYALGLLAEMTTEMFQPQRSGFLADIFVSASHRRQGLGSALVARMAAWFRGQKLSHFEWHVSARNPAAIQFWRSLGGEATMLRMRAELGENKEK